MTLLKNLLILSVIILSFQSCKEDTPPQETETSENTLIGIWNLVNTSGGKTGEGYDAAFDQMIVDETLNFKLNYEGDFVISGKIEEIENPSFDLFVHVIPDDLNPAVYMPIIEDVEKSVEFEGDDLNLIAPCCDRYNFHFVKAD